MIRYFMIAATVFLSGCIAGGKPIEDYADRSVAYAWIDVSEIQGNHLFSASIRQYSPPSDAPYYGMAIKKHEGGYLLYHHGISSGKYEFDQISLQSCLAILCGNTINQYSFSAFADSPGQINASRPGVYFMGAYELRKERGGLFRVGEFSVHKVSGPAKSGMLQQVLADAPPDHPIVAQRIQAEIR